MPGVPDWGADAVAEAGGAWQVTQVPWNPSTRCNSVLGAARGIGLSAGDRTSGYSLCTLSWLSAELEHPEVPPTYISHSHNLASLGTSLLVLLQPQAGCDGIPVTGSP